MSERAFLARSLFARGLVFYSEAEYSVYIVGEIYHREIDDYNGNAEEHIPELIGDDVVEKHEQGIVIVEHGEHVVYLHHVARPVCYVVRDAILVDGEIYKMDDNVRAHGNGGGGKYALAVKLYKTQPEEQYGYAEFEDVGEIVEEERPAEDLRFRDRGVEQESGERAYGPEQEQIAQIFVAGEYRKGKHHGVKRAKVQGQVFYGRVPYHKIIYDSGYSEERQNAENDDLSFCRSFFENKVKTDNGCGSEEQRNDVSDCKSTPNHGRILL